MDKYDKLVESYSIQNKQSTDYVKLLSEYICPHIKTPAKILDNGCGAGICMYMFTKKFGKKATVEGIDINKKMIKEAKKFFKQAKVGNALKLNFKNKTFDYVFMSSLLVEIRGQEGKALKEAKRVLKPEGKLIILTTNHDSLLQALRNLGLKILGKYVEYPKQYTMKEMKTIVENSDFKILNSFYTDYTMGFFSGLGTKLSIPFLGKLSIIDKIFTKIPIINLLGRKMIIIAE